MILRTVKGDLVEMGLNGEFDMIAHGANCFCTMNSGIAAQIKQKIPEAYEADCRTTAVGDNMKLGNMSIVSVPTREGSKFLHVVNAYTQFNFTGRRIGKRDADYEAIREVFEKLNVSVQLMEASGNNPSLKVGIPLIGCGLAGGDWDIVEKIINSTTPNIDITLVLKNG